MKIIDFAVNNFRGISGGLDKNTINFESSNAIFIFGQNNAGKSSMLRAYEAFYNDSVSTEDVTYLAEQDITIEVTFTIDEAKDKPVIELGAPGKYANLRSKYIDSNNIMKLRKTWKFNNIKSSVNETFNVVTQDWEAKGYGGIGRHTVFQPLMMKPLFIHAMPTEDQVESIVNEILKEGATKKLSDTENVELQQAINTISTLQDKIYSKANIDNYKKEVNDRFSSLFSSYEVDINEGISKAKFTHDKIGKDFKIDFKRKADGQSSSNKHMGHGAVRMAIFLLMIMRDELKEAGEAEKNYLILFEEPELFLHPSLTKKLRSLIYEVSSDDMPFQVLCASHSPQMIDITKDHTSLVRMTKDSAGLTALHQVKPEDLTNPEQPTKTEVKQKIYELLRMDPFICESFYADEVILVEGDTEAIILRGYEQEFGFNSKDIFVVNCHSCNNIPFYQKIFSKFNIKYSVICDTDHLIDKDPIGMNRTGWNGDTTNPVFSSGIQKSIYDQYALDKLNSVSSNLLVFNKTFEPAHELAPEPFKFVNNNEAKTVKADEYWKKILSNKADIELENIPIISHVRTIVSTEPAAAETQ